VRVEPTTRVIPTLPAELEGHPITWTPWELSPFMTHVDNGCDMCDHPGPLSVSLGTTEVRQVFHATRCRRCQTTNVITRVWERFMRVKPGTNTPRPAGYVRVWRHDGTEIGADL
jgi:hypothetical protein